MPKQPVRVVPQAFPELGEILDATTDLPLPISQIPQAVRSDVRHVYVSILAKATTGDERGLGLRQLLTFSRMVLTSTEGGMSPEKKIRTKLSLWKDEQFQTLLDMLKEMNDRLHLGQRLRRPPARASREAKREFALRYIQAGRPSKVLDLVMPAKFGGRGDIREEDMNDYFPPAVDEFEDVEPPPDALAPVSPEQVLALIHGADNLKGPGPFGCRMEYLKAIFSRGWAEGTGRAHLVALSQLMNFVNSGGLSREFPEIAPFFYATRVVFLGDKTDTNKFRPIQIGEVLAKLAAHCLLRSDPDGTSFDSLECGPNLAVNTPGGIEAMVLAARAAVRAQEAEPSLVICEVDSKKAFQNIKRNKVVEAHLAAGQHRLAQEAYWRLSVRQIAVMPWGERRTVATGLAQGHPLSPCNFAAGAWLHQRECFKRCEDPPGTALRPLINVNVADDNLFCSELGPALRYLDARLATAQDFGIFTNPVKSRIHSTRGVAAVKEDLASQVEALGLCPELLDFTVEPTSKFVCMQVPVGDREAEAQFMKRRIAETDDMRQALLGGLDYPQAQYFVLKRCLGFSRMNWLLRVGRSGAEEDVDPTLNAALADDHNLLLALSQILKMTADEASAEPTRSLISLSVRRGGLGVRLSSDHLLIARTAALHLSIPTLARISESFRGSEWLAPWRELYEGGQQALELEGHWVPDDPAALATVKHKQRLMSASLEDKMLAEVMQGNLEPELKYSIKCRSSGDPLAHLDSTGFLDCFEERFMPAHYNLLSAERLSYFAPSAKIYIAAPLNPAGGECSAHGKVSRPLGRYMQEALSCESYAGARMLTDILATWLGRFRAFRLGAEQSVRGIAGEYAQRRPGDLTFHLPLTDLRIFVDHTTTSVFAKSAALPEKPENLPLPGSLAFNKEKKKYASYSEILRQPLPELGNLTTAKQRRDAVEALWKDKGHRFVAGPAQSFWPCGVELLGAHGPHLNVLLDFIATALHETGYGSPVYLRRLLRRTLSKLLHDLVGQQILRKIERYTR